MTDIYALNTHGIVAVRDHSVVACPNSDGGYRRVAFSRVVAIDATEWDGLFGPDGLACNHMWNGDWVYIRSAADPKKARAGMNDNRCRAAFSLSRASVPAGVHSWIVTTSTITGPAVSRGSS